MKQANMRQARARHLLVMNIVRQAGALTGGEDDVRPSVRSAGRVEAKRAKMNEAKHKIDQMIAWRDQAARSLSSSH